MARLDQAVLSRESIADAAIALVDGGTDLTMRGLAKRLGVSAPSLYHHVRGKSDVVGLVREVVLRGISPLPEGGDWRTLSKTVFGHLCEFYAAHPPMTSLFVSTPIETDSVLDAYERLGRSYAAAGFSPSATALALEMLESFTLGIGIEHGAPATVWGAREGDDALRDFAQAHVDYTAKLREAYERGFAFLLDGIEANLRPR